MESGRIARHRRQIATVATDASGANRRRRVALLGVILGYTVHGGFFLISGFVGAGLMLAGITGFCGMARLLEKMPWNSRTH